MTTPHEPWAVNEAREQAMYFIRYLPDREKPYRLYYKLPSGLLKRCKWQGAETAIEAVEYMRRMERGRASHA